MTSPIPPSASTPPPTPRPQTAPAAPVSRTTLEVSRAAQAPVYVYRVLDSATGRTLVEIPRQAQPHPGEGKGGALDTTA